MMTTGYSYRLLSLPSKPIKHISTVLLKAKFLHGFFKYWIFL